MAVDHFPEQTLTVHRFSRAGDRWKHAEPLLRQTPIASAVLDSLAVSLEWQDGDYRVPIPCPHCKALTLSRDDNFCVVLKSRGIRHQGEGNSHPDSLMCLACGAGVCPLDWLRGWKARDQDALLTDGALRGFAPKPSTFIVGAVGGKFWIGRTVKEALDPVLPPVFDPVQRLSRIEAMDADHARALVDQHHAAMTWREVPITGDLEPVDPAWHGGPLARWEQEALRRRRQAERQRKRAALEAEIDQLRATRASEIGI